MSHINVTRTGRGSNWIQPAVCRHGLCCQRLASASFAAARATLQLGGTRNGELLALERSKSPMGNLVENVEFRFRLVLSIY